MHKRTPAPLRDSGNQKYGNKKYRNNCNNNDLRLTVREQMPADVSGCSNCSSIRMGLSIGPAEKTCGKLMEALLIAALEWAALC
jgi:hypothetical protein